MDHLSDVVVGVTLGVAIPLVAFRFFTPNSVFPVQYKRGKTAHLDVGGRRGEAIKSAVHDQLGVEVLEVRPGRVTIRMTVRPEMTNGFKVCHGGISFAFADSAFRPNAKDRRSIDFESM